MYYLSIISPFYNSEDKSHRLLSTLSNIKDKGVQIILVDDGSTDNTVASLNEFKRNSEIDVIVITQENKGPGGARNTGLKIAKGDYVWFVDSDDDIMLDALPEIQKNLEDDYNFIDFNYLSEGEPSNSMGLTAGIYIINQTNREILLSNFGRIWTKVINRDFLIKNAILYPEYCIYEDNPLLFVYPFVTTKFIKSNTVAYSYNTELPSVTRSKPSPRYFDRLYTSVYGFNRGMALASTPEEKNQLEAMFISLYLFNTVGRLKTKKPSVNWLSTYNIMKRFRIINKELGIKKSYREILKKRGAKFKIYFLFHWYVSYLNLGNPLKYIEAQRLKAWNRPFNN